MNGLFDREGHVTELTLNRLGANEAFDGKPDVLEHLQTCEICVERHARLDAFDAKFNIAPPGASPVVSLEAAPVISLDERRNRTPLLATFALAACALLAVGLWMQKSPELGDPTTEPDIVRIKGDGFRLDVFVKDEKGSRKASDEEVVHAGDRIGFRIANHRPGYVLIAGLDESGSVYPCYPQASATAKFTEAAADGQDLRAAVQLDDVMGRERIVGAFCPNSFTMNDIKQRLQGASLDAKAPNESMEGCSFEELTLLKRPK